MNKDLLNFMPVYYIDTEKNKTVKMNKQLKKRVKREVKKIKEKKKKEAA